ncbi:tryptophan-rich antigen [Plasmodium gonderi]|uniref:Tryptophan-rich antigen n=1 Tax=Plasmodium gonderi TaxID=77519 RepID=A0A1Y1JD82_PLAGO|nr:tryptophan-rich antigen [Plasmodium gonderi]GAW80446.1 tryptophan-rich antigen [Plasmodium gonderi]
MKKGILIFHYILCVVMSTVMYYDITTCVANTNSFKKRKFRPHRDLSCSDYEKAEKNENVVKVRNPVIEQIKTPYFVNIADRKNSRLTNIILEKFTGPYFLNIANEYNLNTSNKIVSRVTRPNAENIIKLNFENFTREKCPNVTREKSPNITSEKESTSNIPKTKRFEKSKFQKLRDNITLSLSKKKSSNNKFMSKFLLPILQVVQGNLRECGKKNNVEREQTEESSDEWKQQQFRNWMNKLDDDYKAWNDSLKDDKKEWVNQKESVFQNLLKKININLLEWNKATLKEINRNKIVLNDLNSKEQWNKWFDIIWKPYNRQTWLDILDSYDKIRSQWQSNQWKKWKAQKMTEWMLQKWKVEEEEKWEQWESKKWAKYFQRAKKKEWIRWIKRNERENAEINNWIRNKEELSLQRDDWIEWDKWKARKIIALDKNLDSLKNKWIAEEKWKVFTSVSSEQREGKKNVE